MKALEILYRYRMYREGTNNYPTTREYDEAIAELENVSGYQLLVDNRTCEGCKYQTYDNSRENCYILDACVQNYVAIEDNFYCSRWESKE